MPSRLEKHEPSPGFRRPASVEPVGAPGPRRMLTNMLDEITIHVGHAELAAAHLDAICTVYDEVFSRPPFFWRDDESVLHRERLDQLLTDPTFGITVALARPDLVGFAYGFTLPATTQRWSKVTGTLPDETMREWPGRTFLLFDFAVLPAARGHRVGKTLHNKLLASRAEQRATLTVQPTATDTKAIYQNWGWHQIGQMEGGPTAAAPLFDVYLRDSLDDLRHTR
jgi:GNAT superfamily N-acetyltransferase